MTSDSLKKAAQSLIDGTDRGDRMKFRVFGCYPRIAQDSLRAVQRRSTFRSLNFRKARCEPRNRRNSERW